MIYILPFIDDGCVGVEGRVEGYIGLIYALCEISEGDGDAMLGDWKSFHII